MTVRIVVQPEAVDDLSMARAWYEEQQAGLGIQFLERVSEVLERLREHPRLYAVIEHGVRRALVRRFPYIVYYRFEEGLVDVIGVFHAFRDPSAWQARVE